MPVPTLFDRADAIERYTKIAHRLPNPVNPETSKSVSNLADLIDDIDAFVLDGFGVLNVGATTVPGAVERVAQLQSLGKRVLVLTNGATLPVEKTLEKYHKWGMNFKLADVISSRNALEKAMLEMDKKLHWGVIATEFARIEKLAPKTTLLTDNPDDYAQVDGFVFLSATDWSDHRQALLYAALAKKSRPFLVGNPDLTAPLEHGMSMEPGVFSHALADDKVCDPQFYGKPFRAVFELADARIENIAPERIAMVGDTLHTDILGGASFGWRTVLIKNHGLMKEADNEITFQQTGIRPHFIAETT